MRKDHLIAPLLLAALAPTSTHGQWEEVPAASFWSSAYVMSGGSRADRLDLFINDFRELAPGSALLARDLSDHSTQREWSSYRIPERAWGVLVGMRPFRAIDRPGPELRVGVQFAGGDLANLSYSRRDRTRIDTLVSPSSGAMAFVDSVRDSRYEMAFSGERIGAEASVIFRLEGRSRWNLYGGVGVGLGTVLNTRTEVTHTVSNELGYPGGGYSSRTEESESFRSASGAWFATSVPIGLGFRLARRGDFLSRMDLFIESRPTTLWRDLGPLGGRTSFGVQSFFGLRVRMD